MNVGMYPGEIVAVNGSPKGPFAPGPASTFKYDVDVTFNDGTRRIRGVTPMCERWPDTYDVNPLAIGKAVIVYRVGQYVGLLWAELPAAQACAGSGTSP